MAEAVGLYLGTQSLHLVQLSGSFARPRLITVAHADFEPSLTATPEAAQALSQPLRTLLAKVSRPTPGVSVGLSSEAAIVRYFQMPKLPLRDRPLAIRFEAKKYLPFKLEDLVSDFHVVILKSDPTIMRVMFYAVKQDVVAHDLQLLTAVGVRPLSLETSLSSLTRVLRRNRQLESGKTIALLYLNHEMASIAILRDELVYLARNVTVMPPASAEEGLPLPGSAEAPEGPGAKPLSLREALLNETIVSIDYYRRRFTGEPAVTKVIVSGDTVPAQWVSELSQTVELPVQTMTAGHGLPGGEALTGNDAVAFGLALRGLEPRREAINLLPPQLIPKPPGILRRIGVEVGTAAVLLGLLYAVKAHPVRQLTAQLATLQPIVAAAPLTPDEMTVPALQQRLAATKGEIGFLESFRDTAIPPAVLSKLAAAVPETIWFRQVIYDDLANLPKGLTVPKNPRHLTIVGSAFHPEKLQGLKIVNEFAMALNTESALTQPFGRLELVNVQRTPLNEAVEVTDFRITSE